MLLLLACTPPDAASEAFSDAAVAAFAAFDGDEAVLAEAFSELEALVDEETDATANDYTQRSLSPEPLPESATDGIVHPDRDPSDALPVALAWLSPHPPAGHDAIALLADLTAVEPNSPSLYDRHFDEGGDCYPECPFLRTTNQVTRENVLMSVTHELKKDFRALSMADGRAARASRGWIEVPGYDVDGRATIEQSYAIEFWIERDGGALRLQVSWVETTFANAEYDDEMVAATTVYGIDAQFDAHDAWIAEQPG